MINGCLTCQKFDVIVELLKDAVDQGIYIPNDLTQSILDEVNKLPYDSNGYKSNLTTQILLFVGQKENNYMN